MWNSTMQKAFNDLPTTKNSVSMFPTTATVRDNQEVDYVYPVIATEVYPGDTIELKMSGLKRILDLKHLPYDGLKTKYHFFFVPNRLVWDNWDEFMGAVDLAREYDFDPTELTVPKLRGKPKQYSIYDYMGEPISDEDGGQVKEDIEMNALPYRGWNLIRNTYLRKENIQPYSVVHRGNDGDDEMSDYVLYKVNKDLDLFTSCLPWAQKGDPVELNLGGTAPIIAPENDKIKVKGILDDTDTIDDLKDNPLKIAGFSRTTGDLKKRIIGLGMELVPTVGNDLQYYDKNGLKYYRNALAQAVLQIGVGGVSKDLKEGTDISTLNVPIELKGSQQTITDTNYPNVSQLPSPLNSSNQLLNTDFGSVFTWNNINMTGLPGIATGAAAYILGNGKDQDGVELIMQNNADYAYGQSNMNARITNYETGDNTRRVPQTTPVQFSSDSYIGQLDKEDIGNLKADLSQASSTITVNDFRLEVLRQQFEELKARAGAGRYNELVYAIWGVDMGVVRGEIPEYLGGFSLNWNFIPVVQTAPAAQENSTNLGTLAANGELKFANKLCFRRSFTEYGFIIGITYTKGDLSYSQGTPLKNTRTTDMDYFIPMFQDAGEQPIFTEQIYCTGEEENDKEVFGYMPYGSKEKFIQSRDSADFRPLSDGNGGLKQNLAMWHFGEYFEDAPKLGAKFLESNTPIERICNQHANPRHIEGIVALQMKAFRQMKTVCTPGIDKI